MTADLLTLPVALPLGASAATLLLRRYRGAQRAIALLTAVTVLLLAVVFLDATRDGSALGHQVGGWVVGIAIPFAADGFAALLLLVASFMTLACLLFAMAREEDVHELFHPMVMALVAGVFGSFLTGDLFNLFVMFEVMLIASYVLLTLRGGARQVRAGALYVAVNLLASTVFLAGIALVYGTTGTVNFGDLAGAAADDPLVATGAGVIFLAVAVKAAIVPLHTWLPRSYVEASPAVTALFSGLLTKAGVYVLFRLYSVVFDGAAGLQTPLIVAAGVTMVLGVFGAVGKDDMRGILAFHMVSQMGYLILPLGLWSAAALSAGIFYLFQYIAVKGSLFLAAGAVETFHATGKLSSLGGLARSRPILATGFLLSALALAGLPPTSGFVGKYLLIRASFEGAHWIAGGVALAVSFFTLMSMIKIWNGVFWGEPTPAAAPARVAEGMPVPAGGSASSAPAETELPAVASRGRVAAIVAPCVVIGVATLVLGVGAQPLLEVVEPAAEALLDPSAYLEAIGARS